MSIDWNGGLNAFYRRDIVAAALRLTAKACAVDIRDVAAGRRKSKVAFARQVAMYLCHVVGDMSLRDVAEEFGRDRTTVSHAAHAIEDRRDCPIFDRQIEHLERALRTEIALMIQEEIAAPQGRETKSFKFAWSA